MSPPVSSVAPRSVPLSDDELTAEELQELLGPPAGDQEALAEAQADAAEDQVGLDGEPEEAASGETTDGADAPLQAGSEDSAGLTLGGPDEATGTESSALTAEDTPGGAQTGVLRAPPEQRFQLAAVRAQTEPLTPVSAALGGDGFESATAELGAPSRERAASSAPVLQPQAPPLIPPNNALPPDYKRWAPYVEQAAKAYDLEPSLIYGVMSRETNGQNVVGDFGHGRGLMQIDDRWWGGWLANHDGGMNPQSNIQKGAEILRDNIDYFNGNVRQGVAAYNAGPGNVSRALSQGLSPDFYTTGGNYSADVLARAANFRRLIGPAQPGGAGAQTFTEYLVRPGDNLGGIAARHGSTVRALAEANGIADPDRLYAGQWLRIPIAEGEAPARPGREPQRPAQPPSPSEERPVHLASHTVRPGDTLSGIAERMGTTTEALRRRNGIRDPDLIHVGEVIYHPKQALTQHVVKRGETLSEIAERMGTSVQALQVANGITDPDLIHPGQLIRSGPGQSPYRVRPGDTLGEIAERMGTSVQALAQANGLANPNLIFPGQTLRRPARAGGRNDRIDPAERPSGSVPGSVDGSPQTPGRGADPVKPVGGRGPAQPPLQSNVQKALAYGLALVGSPYGWWWGGPIPQGAPAYARNGPPPDPSFVRANGVFCAGVTNLMLRAIGKPLPSTAVTGTGGTGAYGQYYSRVAVPFDPNRKYPEGTLLGRRYRNVNDQGHVAVVLENGNLLQSYPDSVGGRWPGVNTRVPMRVSHAGYYYEYAVLPEDWLG